MSRPPHARARWLEQLRTIVRRLAAPQARAGGRDTAGSTTAPRSIEPAREAWARLRGLH